ncbi:hypothetical protein ACTXT7_015815 [Hymenolepis weldensis]
MRWNGWEPTDQISTQRNLLKSCGILLALPNSPDSFIPDKPSIPFQLQSYWQMHKPMILEADNWTQPRLCSVAVSWGFISEVDLRSDFMRILGSVRFQIIFAYLLTKLKKYRCEFSFLLARQDEALMKQLRDSFGDQLHVSPVKASVESAYFGYTSLKTGQWCYSHMHA